MLTLDKVYHAKHVLKEVLRPTQVINAPQINPKANVYLKTENLQVTGSFKVRGAYYKISQLSEEEKSHGVIACSAGNHAQGVALAAQKSGIKATICLPDGAPISKVEATRSYGAEIFSDAPCRPSAFMMPPQTCVVAMIGMSAHEPRSSGRSAA